VPVTRSGTRFTAATQLAAGDVARIVDDNGETSGPIVLP
jgi:hypothetical protein